MPRCYTLLIALLLSVSSLSAQYPDTWPTDYEDEYARQDRRIQIALLLDVSGSMDGLIEQAKTQLWHIVNGLMYQYDGERPPRLELALYEFGSERLRAREGYLRQLVPFTTDLDWVSSELFRLRADGRYEYCGAVLDAALRELTWSHHPDDQHLIYIAGNESFNQGPVSARTVLRQAFERGIVVNSVFCGRESDGRREGWSEAAYYGGGEYFVIDQNHHDRYDRDPYGGRLLGLNQQLNQTYVPYGPQASHYWQRQQHEDRHAQQYGSAVASQRALAKASPAYVQPQWDLVDAVATGQVDLASLPQEQLPTEMQGMSLAAQQQYLQRKAEARQAIRREMRQVAVQAPAVAAPAPAHGSPSRPAPSTRPTPTAAPTLGDAILQSAQPRTRTQPRRSTGSPNVQRQPTPRPAPRTTRPSWPSPRPQPAATPSRPSRPKPAARPAPRPRQPAITPSPPQRTITPATPSRSPRPQPAARPAPAQPRSPAAPSTPLKAAPVKRRP